MKLCSLICMPPTREFLDRTQVLCCFPATVAFTYKLMAKTIIYSAENCGDLVIKYLHMQRKHKTRMASLAFILQPPRALYHSNESLQANVNQHYNLQMFWLGGEKNPKKQKTNSIAMDTKGLGWETKAERDNEQILRCTGVVSFWNSIYSFHSFIYLSCALNHSQGSFQSYCFILQ